MYKYKAKLDRVVDGDTIDANIDLGFDVSVKKRIRLAGINAPESRTRDLEEKKLGLAAKQRLIELLDSGDFILESKELGKYGRVLGEIFTTNKDGKESNINKTLIAEGYAVEYNGGKR